MNDKRFITVPMTGEVVCVQCELAGYLCDDCLTVLGGKNQARGLMQVIGPAFTEYSRSKVCLSKEATRKIQWGIDEIMRRYGARQWDFPAGQNATERIHEILDRAGFPRTES